MRFIIDGHEFGMESIADLTQQDLFDMAKQAGMGVQTWMRRIDQIGRLALDEDGETVIVLSESEAKEHPDRLDSDLMTESAPHLHAFLIMVWLGRRRSGEPTLKYAESTALPWRSLTLLGDDEAEPEEVEAVADPSVPSGSAPDSDGVAPSTSTQP